jgi:hypothetical protein
MTNYERLLGSPFAHSLSFSRLLLSEMWDKKKSCLRFRTAAATEAKDLD